MGDLSERLLSIEDALDAIRSATAGALGSTSVRPEDALGRWLAADVAAATDLPPWDNSAMDGYAIRSVDTVAATVQAPVRLRVIGEAPAGVAAALTVDPGTAVRIATGAPLPPGADAVVPVEATTRIESDGTVGRRGGDATGPLPAACVVDEPVAAGGSVRSRASDVRAGTTVLRTGDRMTPSRIALAAGVGAAEVEVGRRPIVAVLATGDEVRPAGESLGPAGIPDANGPALRALVRVAGGEALDLGIAADRLEAVQAAVERGVAAADVVIVSGGVSVGPYDVVRRAFSAVGTVQLWRVAVQPGKPFAFGTADRPGHPRGVALFGLPGNPVSTAVTFEIFVRPIIEMLAGAPATPRSVDRGVLVGPVSSSPGRRTFVRVAADRRSDGTIARDDQGRVPVRPAGGQGSHVLSALAAADGLAIVPEAVTALPAGADVALWWLDAR